MSDVVLQMRAEAFIENRLGYGGAKALSAVLVAISCGLFQQGMLGDDLWPYRNLVSLLSLSMLPLFVFISVPKTKLSVLFITNLIVFAIAPSFYSLMYELCLGHTRKDAQWYDALWRIYAILFIWVMAAVVNECKVRPILRAREKARQARIAEKIAKGESTADEIVGNSVQSRANNIKTKARDEAVRKLDQKITRAQRQKEVAEKTITRYGQSAERAQRNIEETEKLVAKAKNKLEEVPSDAEDRGALENELRSAEKMADAAIDYESSLELQKEAQELVLAEALEKLRDLKREREAAMDVDKYGFYR